MRTIAVLCVYLDIYDLSMPGSDANQKAEATAARLRRILATVPKIPPLAWILSGQAAVGPGVFSGQMWRPSILICLRGQAHYQVPVKGQVQEVMLRRHHALVMQDGCSLAVRPRRPYRSLMLGIGQDHLHAHIAQHDHHRRPRPAAKAKEQYDFRFRLSQPLRFSRPEPPTRDLHHSMQALLARVGSAPEDALGRRLLGICIELFAQACAEDLLAGDKQRSKRRFHAARAFVDEHLQTDLRRTDVADAVGVDPAHVSRLFTRYAGCSFNAYLWRQRLDLACRLLADVRYSISDVALSVGCADVNYFSRRFAEHFGVPPSRWRTERRDSQT